MLPPVGKGFAAGLPEGLALLPFPLVGGGLLPPELGTGTLAAPECVPGATFVPLPGALLPPLPGLFPTPEWLAPFVGAV